MLTVFMHLNATAHWLRMSRAERAEFVATAIVPIMACYPQIALSTYDVEGFSGLCSDILVFEGVEPQAFGALIDDLRDTALYTAPYFEVAGIYPALKANFI